MHYVSQIRRQLEVQKIRCWAISVHLLIDLCLGGELFTLLRDREVFDVKTTMFYRFMCLQKYILEVQNKLLSSQTFMYQKIIRMSSENY